MASKEEIINGQTRYRSGKYYSFRRCPKHNCNLELCINDTDFSEWSDGHQQLYNHHENRIEWRCDSCYIFWNENYFQKEASPKTELPLSQLVLICPICESERVTHECTPLCCTDHYCIDCKSRFTAEIDPIKKGYKKITDDEDVLDSEFCPADSQFQKTKTSMTGIFRKYRKCPNHKNEPLELVFIHAIDAVPIRIEQPAWFCKLCNRVYFECGNYRRSHKLFSFEVRAAIECPFCNTFEINSGSNSKRECISECISCGALLRIKLYLQK